MAEINLVFGAQQKAKIGVLQLDSSDEEVHRFEAMITEHPVETGIDISDHIRRRPYVAELSGRITNTPIVNREEQDPASPDLTDTTSPDDRVEVAYAKLIELLTNGSVVDVVTTLATYPNMVIQNYSVVRNVEFGNILNLTVTMRELLTVETEQAEVPEPVTVSKRKTTNQGKKSKQAANQKQTEKAQSVLSKLFG